LGENIVDEGIWATWFDLSKKVRSSHIRWLHKTYLPEISTRPGIAWAAHYELHPEIYAKQRGRLKHTDEPVGQALQHLVLIGASSPNIFFHTVSPLEKKNQSKETRARLAEREEVRTLITAEEHRVNGPEYDLSVPGGVPGACIQMGSFNMTTPESEIGLGQWYEQMRYADFARTPSCIRMRKLLGVAGWAKHAVLYEFTSNEERAKNMESGKGTSHSNRGEKIIAQTVHSPGSPVIGLRQWPKVPKGK
jgi:hypothetical protein